MRSTRSLPTFQPARTRSAVMRRYPHRPVRGLRIGIDTSYNEDQVDAEIIQALREVRSVLERQGATIRDENVPGYTALTQGWGSIAGVEAAIVHAKTYPSRASEYGPAVSGAVAGLIEHGRTVTASDLMQVHYARLAFGGALAALFHQVDLLLIPVQPLANFTIANEAELFAQPEALSAFLRFTAPFDMSGSPTITLPGGFTLAGLPIAFQLVSRHLDEALLVQAAHDYQQVTNWHRKHPRL
ncbi:amidase family protein [Granulicella paludicola]|uniref:amidase family protein n=1 Tax=Granulicella paludicola TaxID=474951 RepID=UPI00295BF4A2|nr:amidase family protein [Granulicella paludicola]